MTRTWIGLARAASALALAAALAGCTSGSTASATAGTGAGASASASLIVTPPPPLASSTPSATPPVAPSPVASLPAAPPNASLDGLARPGHAAGSLGTYTWGGGGSDAPWIIGRRAGTASTGASLTATFGGLLPASWTAAWAKVKDGSASGPVGATSGSGAAIVTAPSAGGDWSLRVTAQFGPGASATYYWRLTVSP